MHTQTKMLILAIVITCALLVLLALLLQLAGLADNNPPERGSKLPAPEYIDADIVLMERGVAPALNRTGLAQPELAEDPEPEPRYAPITPEERELIARVVHLEANNQPFAGQQAVAEVILNRRAAANFPDTVEAVIYQKNPVQFTVTSGIPYCTPTDENYAAVDAAMYGEPVYESMDVVYYNVVPECWANLAGVIGDHYFCYQYSWARTEV